MFAAEILAHVAAQELNEAAGHGRSESVGGPIDKGDRRAIDSKASSASCLTWCNAIQYCSSLQCSIAMLAVGDGAH